MSDRIPHGSSPNWSAPLWNLPENGKDSPVLDGHSSPGPESRYLIGPLLGSGGMGRVLLGHDPVLQRELAVKQALTPASAGRLRREAQLLAKLDHPSIVAVYDADLTVPWYAMRLVRGATLTEAIGNCADLAARLRLLRHVLAACEGVAHAHAVGIAHRDLKPDNILVSDLGETQVLDWGLAAEFSAERSDELQALAQGNDADARHEPPSATVAGAVLGTPRYLSPEAARGESLDQRTDVWGLGVILWQTLTGQLPWHNKSLPEILAELREGRSPLLAEEQDHRETQELPVELLAISRRATAAHPDQRYPDARALATDLQNWLEGRQVSAHAYTRGELARRAVKILRLPLAISALAMAMIATVVTIAAVRVLQERDLARASLQSSQRARAALWAGQAVAHAKVGAAPEAELAAATALQFGPTTAESDGAAARGVLAMVGAGPRVALVSEWSKSDCREVAVAEDGGDVLCFGAGTASLWSAGATEPRWRAALDVHAAVLSGAGSAARDRVVIQTTGDTAVVLRRSDGAVVGSPVQGGRHRTLTLGDGAVAQPLGTRLAVTDLASASQQLLQACANGAGEGHLEAVAKGSQQSWWVACGDGSVRRVQQGAVNVVAQTALRPPLAVATALHLTPAGVLYIGSSKGHLLRLDPAAAHASLLAAPQDLSTPSARAAAEAAIARPMASLIRDVLEVAGWLAVRGDRGEVRLLHTETLEQLASLPGEGHGALAIADGRDLMSGGSHARRWRLPPLQAGARIALQERRSATGACRLRDGLVVPQGTGDVEKLDPLSGQPLWQTRWQSLVVKTAACDTQRNLVWAAAMDQPAVVALDGASGQRSGLWPLPQPVRRLVARGQAGWLAATIGGGLWTGGAAITAQVNVNPAQGNVNPAQPQLIGSAQADWIDLDGGDGSPGAVHCAVAGSSGEVVAVLGAALTRLALRPGTRACTAVSAGGVVLALDGQLELRAAATALWSRQLDSKPTDLSSDGPFLAVALTNGEGLVVRASDGALVARLGGHQERIATVLFDPLPPARLWTASWDGTVRAWDSNAWQTADELLVEAARKRWGQAAERALADNPALLP